MKVMLKIKLQYVMGLISPKLITNILYYKTFHKILNLKNPKTINEKIHWMKFYGDTSKWVIFADKYRVREYVTEKGLEDTLVKLYGCWTNVEDINWGQLPNQFVLKVNNGCGDILICKDKTNLDIPSIKKIYGALLKEKFGITTGQLQYRKMPACIIAEELLDAKKQSIQSSSLVDYKIWCFNGYPEYIFVYTNRNKSNAECMVFDINWNAHPEYMITSSDFSIINYEIPKPSHLDEMLRVAGKLSEDNPEMCVDLYEVDGKVYFGELTMTAACGLMNHFTNDFLTLMGSKVNLPNINS